MLKFTCRSYSNIALIKYWGKKNHQEPLNPSLSFTLKNSYTEMSVSVENSDQFEFSFNFEGSENLKFKEKIRSFIKDLSFLQDKKIKISSRNSFPHSTGIASSASAMSCLSKALHQIKGVDNVNDVSSMARTFSGSACRSVCSGFNVWGDSELLSGSNNQFSINIDTFVDKDFFELKNYILVVNDKEKSKSSSQGHLDFNNSFFKDARIAQANAQFKKLLKALEVRDWKVFSDVVREEALGLHGLMYLSNPPVNLLEGNSLEIINFLEPLREKYEYRFSYSIDAGANIHLIFHCALGETVENIFLKDLKPFVKYVIKDEVNHES